MARKQIFAKDFHTHTASKRSITASSDPTKPLPVLQIGQDDLFTTFANRLLQRSADQIAVIERFELTMIAEPFLKTWKGKMGRIGLQRMHNELQWQHQTGKLLDAYDAALG